MRLRVLSGAVLALFIGFSGVAAHAQDSLRQALFEEAKDALIAANQADAAVLAPVSYAAGAENYKRAESQLERGGNVDRIRSLLGKAVSDWQNAVKATEIARVTLTKAIQAREDAINAEAKTYAPEAWTEAQLQFSEATTRLENGSLRAAQRYGDKAESIFREAELGAIKANYLNETQSLLVRAEKMKAKKYAPNTLASAQSLYLEAEKELTENRYDTDRPRSLAQSAKHEVNTAIYLTENLARVDRKRDQLEQFIVDWQTPVKRIGAALDIPVYFDNGYEEPTGKLVSSIEQLLQTSRVQSQDLQEKKGQIRDLETQIVALEKRLGGASQERLALAAQLDQQARIKAKFANVEEMFNRDEAIVFRTGNTINLRMVGLTFDSGKFDVKPEHYLLLGKVRNAFAQFEQKMIEVEGHTDAFGSDETNLTLSTERAAAVKAYMHASMGLAESQVKAVGYGEARPIANNETPEGRAKNRRIDIVIKPIL